MQHPVTTPLSSLRSSARLFLSLLLLLSTEAPSLRAQSKDDCLECHKDKDLSTERNGKTISLYAKPEALDKSPHRKQACVACHTGFDPGNIPHKEKIVPVKCSSCHQTAELKHPFHAKMLAQARKAGQFDAARLRGEFGLDGAGALLVEGGHRRQAGPKQDREG